MGDNIRPDISCVPYRRKGLYLVLTIPLLVLLVSVFIYLWTYGFVLSIALLSFYSAMCYFQAYCCGYQGCPYVGGFCPAIVGIIPASLLTKLIYGKKQVVRSKKSFEMHAVVASLGWLALIVFPLFWIAKLGIAVTAGYVVCHAVYYVIFGVTICSACAIRHTCPGGKLQSVVLKR